MTLIPVLSLFVTPVTENIITIAYDKKDIMKGSVNAMTDSKVLRERIESYTDYYGVPYTFIGREAGLGEPSRYLVSRFMRGKKLDPDTMYKLDTYLNSRGY